MKKEYSTIKQFDYSSKEEFEKHKIEMKNKGYVLIDGMFSGVLDPKDITGDDNWKYSASFIKSDYM